MGEMLIKDTTNITVKQLVNSVMQQAEEKKFGTRPEEINVYEKLLLAQSEISEAFDAFRKMRMTGKDSFEEELGDAVQVLLHISGVYRIDIAREILKKIEENKKREWKRTERLTTRDF